MNARCNIFAMMVALLCGSAAAIASENPCLTGKLEAYADKMLDKGGNIPADVKRLSGARIRVRGFMIPMDQAENITQFALVPKMFGSAYLLLPRVQHIVVANTPRDKPAPYCPDEIVVEGTLTVEEKKEDGYIVSIFGLAVTSVKPAPKQALHN